MYEQEEGTGGGEPAPEADTPRRGSDAAGPSVGCCPGTRGFQTERGP